ncbi:hypothetical protein TNCV_4144791 [Trichonephila clavipes]|nr:hypothetical protein TNCV_4144791 [Trichonephila clavipes]
MRCHIVGSRIPLHVVDVGTVSAQHCVDEVLEAYGKLFWVAMGSGKSRFLTESHSQDPESFKSHDFGRMGFVAPNIYSYPRKQYGSSFKCLHGSAMWSYSILDSILSR